MSTKQQELDKVKQEIKDKNICPDLSASAKQLVFGEGSVDAELFFIGEAPGKKEDEQGIPFIGAAGKFLNEMLASINLKREDIYITNIVKYRPPENRDPSPAEKTEFLPYLHRQLEIIKPKLVITLGRHSMNCFLPELQISNAHGKPVRVKLTLGEKAKQVLEILILPLFHPAAALYNGGLRKTLYEDFAQIPQILNKITN